ncbi:MAG: DNA-binding protein [Sulfuricaulis sp.]
MARGVTQDQVTRAADALLLRGERPTIEKVRAQLGTGSPNTLLRLIDVWWADLATRLAGEARLPDLPADVAAAFKAAWTVACEQGAAIADKAVSETRDALEQQRISMSAERLRWSADLESARSDLGAAQGAQALTEARLADHQRLVEQLQAELRDVKAQRDKLQEQAELLVQDMLRLGAKLENQEKQQAAERISTAEHIRSVEDRAHAEVDRARAEIKVLRTMHTQAERAAREALGAAARDHKEHLAQLRTAERDATAQRARAEALEGQLQRLAIATSSAAIATRRTGTRRPAERKEKAAAKKRLLERMMTSTARASAAIDDAVAYVESSNRKLARKKNPG